MQVTRQIKDLVVRCIICIVFCFSFLGSLIPMETIGEQTFDGGGHFISPSQAQANAKAGLTATPWLHQTGLAAKKNEMTAEPPLLVQRIDREESFYYLVPFNVQAKTVAVVIVDAKSGRFKESAKMGQPERYPKVSAEQAQAMVVDYLIARSLPYSSGGTPPRLVWRPCEQTQSPYEPLWCVPMGAGQWFVDFGGKVYPEIVEVKLKGGGWD